MDICLFSSLFPFGLEKAKALGHFFQCWLLRQCGDVFLVDMLAGLKVVFHVEINCSIPHPSDCVRHHQSRLIEALTMPGNFLVMPPWPVFAVRYTAGAAALEQSERFSAGRGLAVKKARWPEAAVAGR